MAPIPITRASVLASCAGALAYPFAAGADYSWELSGFADHAELENPLRLAFEQSQSHMDGRALSATYYFDPVDDETGPHALAAFFDPASRLSIGASRDKETLQRVRLPSGVTDFEFEYEERDSFVSGEYLLPRSKWYVGGLYSQDDVVDDDTTSGQGYGVVAGKYLGAGMTRVELALGRATTDAEFTFTTGTSTGEDTEDTVTLDIMHVLRYPSATYTIFGSVSGLDSSTFAVFTPANGAPPTAGADFDVAERRAYSIGAQLFGVQAGLRVGYTRFDGTTSEDDSIDLGASWFFRGAVGFELTLSRDGTRPPTGSSTGGLIPLPSHTDRAALRVIGRF